MEKGKIVWVCFSVLVLVSFSLTAFSDSGDSYLRQEAQDFEPERISQGVYDDKDSGYFDAGSGTAASCQGGNKSLECRDREVSLEGGSYTVASPWGYEIAIAGVTIPLPKLRAHYLNLSTDDYIVIKYLGEMRLIKPEEQESGDIKYEVYSWIPGNNFLADTGTGGTVTKCCEYTSDLRSALTNPWPEEDVTSCESQCGIRFTIGRNVSLLTTIIIKEVAFTASEKQAMEARRDERLSLAGTGAPPEQPGGGFTSFFYWTETVAPGQEKSDYVKIRDNVVGTFVGLSEMTAEQVKEEVYVSRLNDYFEVREYTAGQGVAAGARLSCDSTRDYAPAHDYVIRCYNTQTGRDYVLILKYYSGGNLLRDSLKFHVNENRSFTYDSQWLEKGVRAQ